MRIAYFHYTPRIGGAERFLADIVAGAQQAGHETVVLSPQRFLLDFVGEGTPEAELFHVPLPDLPSGGAPLATTATLIREVPRLVRSIRGTQATLLHVNNGGYPGSDYGRLALLTAPLARIPVRLMSVHSTPLGREHSQPQLQAIVDQMVWRSVDAVHAPSAFVKGKLEELRGMPPALCVHLPCGVSEPALESSAELRKCLAADGTRLLVGMVSSSGERFKGHHVLLEALAETDEAVSAVVVGAHPGESFLEQIERLHLRERIKLTGPVSALQVGPYLGAVDLIVVPSVAFESQVLVALEAMAASKAVFASRLAGIPEGVVDGVTGRLFTPGSADELASLLREACAEPRRLEEMGRAGRERWRERYTSGEMVSSILALYDELVAR